MSEDMIEQKVAQLSGKFDALFTGFKAFMFLTVLIASSANFAAVFSVWNYERIFAYALPGKPLPEITLLVMGAKGFLMTLVFFWPTVALNAIFIRERIVLSLMLLSAALSCAFIEATIVWVAMQLPMMTLIQGIGQMGN